MWLKDLLKGRESFLSNQERKNEKPCREARLGQLVQLLGIPEELSELMMHS